MHSITDTTNLSMHPGLALTEHRRRPGRAFAGALLALLALTVGHPRASAQQPPGVRSQEDLAAMMVATLPPGALEITEAMPTAKVGSTVVLRGSVARSRDAFVSGRTVFTLVDESTNLGCCPPSDNLPDTACSIPASGRATIQILDERGRPLRFGLDGLHGLRPGAEVFVRGRIDAANGKDLLVVTADAMHVPKASLPTCFFLGRAPQEVRDVSEFRAGGAPKVGDPVVLRGRVGGNAAPFADGRARMTLIGRDLAPCSEVPQSGCRTPWDCCAASREAILRNSVTVQVVDARRQPLSTALKGRRGLKELSEVVVVGTVSAVDGDAVTVDCTAMWVSG